MCHFLLDVTSKNFQSSSGQPALYCGSKHLQNHSALTQERFILFIHSSLWCTGLYRTNFPSLRLHIGLPLCFCAHKTRKREMKSRVLVIKYLHSIVTWSNMHCFYSHFISQQSDSFHCHLLLQGGYIIL